jgi:hypothetical protein
MALGRQAGLAAPLEAVCFLLQKCKDPEASAVDTFARTEPPDTQVSVWVHCLNSLHLVECLAVPQIVTQNGKFIQMETANPNLTDKDGTMPVCLHCSPQSALHTALMPGLLEGTSFVVGAEVI